MPSTDKNCVVTPEQAGRADLVVQQLTQLPRRQIRGLFDQQRVIINGTPCTQTFFRVEAGDVVHVRFAAGQRYREAAKPWQDTAFRIVFEDEHLIVVDKAAHILTVPTDDNEPNTLIDRVTRYLQRSGRRGEAFIAHRLDRGVSGLLVVGKSEAISTKLRDQFEERKPQRNYVAIVAGTPAHPAVSRLIGTPSPLLPGKGTFRSYLATAENLDRFSTTIPDKGQLAITHFTVARVLTDTTIVNVQLETGRRNQIRVHFSEVGHPVIGDTRYESRAAHHPRWRVRRLALHSTSLGFTHPVTAAPMQFQSELPPEFDRFISGKAGFIPYQRKHPRSRRPPRDQ